MSWGGAERGGNTKQAPGSELLVQSPTRGSNSQTVRSWPEPESEAQPTEPPRGPRVCRFYPCDDLAWIPTFASLAECVCQRKKDTFSYLPLYDLMVSGLG